MILVVCLNLSSVRLSYLKMFLDRWKGPISAVIYTPPEELSTIVTFFRKSDFPSRLVISIVSDSGPDYPINALRNLAIKAVSTSHFYLSDMDVWPSSRIILIVMILASLYPSFIDALGSQTIVGSVLRQDRTAVIIPVYEYTVACSSFNNCVKELSFIS